MMQDELLLLFLLFQNYGIKSKNLTNLYENLSIIFCMFSLSIHNVFVFKLGMGCLAYFPCQHLTNVKPFPCQGNMKYCYSFFPVKLSCQKEVEYMRKKKYFSDILEWMRENEWIIIDKSIFALDLAIVF